MERESLAVRAGTYEVRTAHGTATVHAPRDWTAAEMMEAVRPLVVAATMRKEGNYAEKLADAD